MSDNRGVIYLGEGKVQVQSIPYPKMQDPRGRKIEHGVILRVVSTNICGSDQHMVRGRTTAQVGLVLGHEITGEVIEKGADVETSFRTPLVKAKLNVSVPTKILSIANLNYNLQQSTSRSDRFIPNRNSVDVDIGLHALFAAVTPQSSHSPQHQSATKQAHNRQLESLLLSASPSRSHSGRLLPCFDSPPTKPKSLGILEVGRQPHSAPSCSTKINC